MFAYVEMIKARGGGIVTCGEHLGVFISTPDNVKNCPVGWGFIDVNEPAEKIQELIDHVKKEEKRGLRKTTGRGRNEIVKDNFTNS